MNFAEQIKDFSSHQASRMIVELLLGISGERLVQLTYLGEKLTSDAEVLGAIKGVRNLLLDPTHPAKEDVSQGSGISSAEEQDDYLPHPIP